MCLYVRRSLEYLDCVHGLYKSVGRALVVDGARAQNRYTLYLDVLRQAEPRLLLRGGRARDPDGNQIKVKGHCRT